MKHYTREASLQKLLEAYQCGNHQESIRISKFILRHNPELAIAWNILAITKANLSDYEAAIQAFTTALSLEPYNFHICNNLGNALKSKGDRSLAEVAYRRSITLSPDFHVAHLNLAGLYPDEDEAGIQLLKRSFLSRPDFSDAALLMADQLIAQERYDECINALSAAPGSHGFRYETQTKVIACHLRRTDYELSIKLSRWLILISPERPEAYVSLSLAMGELNISPAASLFRAALIAPEDKQTEFLIATNHIDEGRFESAKAHIKNLLDRNPSSGAALALVPSTRKMRGDDLHWLHSAIFSLNARDAAPHERVSLLFAIGKYYDDLKDYDNAFSYYEKANAAALERGKGQENNDVSQLYKEIISAHTKEDITKPVGGHSDSERPVFIVGMPRSGSSLIEQIMASHPQIGGAGELPFWGTTIKRLGKHIEHPQTLPEVEARQITSSYLEALAPFDAPRVINKTLINFVFLGYILALFPKAKIIHVHRNPIDTCLSIYFSNFGLDKHPYSYRLLDIRSWYIQYHALMTHWLSIIPADRIMNLSYRDLVSDRDHWTKITLAFVGVSYDPACANFFNTERRVHTSSNWQVRQPIYSSSLDRWRNYETHLEPLMDLPTRCSF